MQHVPPPPRVPTSVFAGRGMFTVERPEDAAGFRLSYVLAATGAFTWVTPGAVVWQDESAEQYAEALREPLLLPLEHALVTTLDGSYHALDSWPDGWTCLPECYWNADGGKPGVGRSVPNMLWRARQVIGAKWGKVPVVPVVGCYDASDENPGIGVRLTLADYLPDLRAATDPCVVGYAIWRVETLAAEDSRLLRT